MELKELIEYCKMQLKNGSRVMLSLPGTMNQSGKKRFPCGGPIGEINGEDMTAANSRVLVFFDAQELLTFLESDDE